MAEHPDPTAEETLQRFWTALAKHAFGQGWVVVREMVGRSNRGFILEKDGREIHFFVKVSQSTKGFWGLPPQKAAEIITGGREALILLRSPSRGYVVTPGRLKDLLPVFSVAKEHEDYKINEGKVSSENPFNTIVRLWAHLERQVLERPSP